VVNDLTKSLLAARIKEAGENTGSEGEGAVEVLFAETVVTQVQFARGSPIQISLVDSKRVQTGNMMTANLVGADKKLNLQVVNDIGGSSLRTRDQRRNTTTRGNGWGSLEGLGGRHAVGMVPEVDLPREVDRSRVLEPGRVHFLDIAGRVTLEEGVLGGGDVVLGGSGGGFTDRHHGGDRSSGASQGGAHQEGGLARHGFGSRARDRGKGEGHGL
jgi:hypothetical protein